MKEIYLEELKFHEFIKILGIYHEAFPAEERKPFSMLLKMRRQGNSEMLVIHDKQTGKAVGLAFTMTGEKLVVLDYLAIDKKHRSDGYGSALLSEFRMRYEGRTVLIEIETPDENAENNEQRIRREAFYLRNGMKKTGIIIMLFGVQMQILSMGNEEITFEKYYGFLETVFGTKLSDFLRKNVSFVRTEKSDNFILNGDK